MSEGSHSSSVSVAFSVSESVSDSASGAGLGAGFASECSSSVLFPAGSDSGVVHFVFHTSIVRFDSHRLAVPHGQTPRATSRLRSPSVEPLVSISPRTSSRSPATTGSFVSVRTVRTGDSLEIATTHKLSTQPARYLPVELLLNSPRPVGLESQGLERLCPGQQRR